MTHSLIDIVNMGRAEAPRKPCGPKPFVLDKHEIERLSQYPKSSGMRGVVIQEIARFHNKHPNTVYAAYKRQAE